MESKYKKGDKVRIIREKYGHRYSNGEVVTIVANPEEDSDEEPHYQTMVDPKDTDGYVWYVWESEIEPVKETALDTQVGGNHYKEMKIQPVEFILANNLNFLEGNIIKYVCRYKTKNGLEDLKKARHYLDLLIESLEKE